MKISGKQVKAARDLLGITQGELGKATGLALNTISNFESGKADPYQASLDKIVEELERRGIEFTNGTGIGVRLNFEKAELFARADKASVI
jgi:transcriptional regulator with XRE-family HTH domain